MSTDRILITGSTGFIGTKVVKALIELGYEDLRCFARPSSNVDGLHQFLRTGSSNQFELVQGDLSSREDCRRAVEGVSVILHLAAGFDKSFPGAFMNSVLTTRNLFEAFFEKGQPRRFVLVSSFAVYSNFHLKRNAVLDESCPLEAAHHERYSAYSFSKLKQEQIVRELSARFKIPHVILRPGAVFGPGKRELSGRVGINLFGTFLHMGGANLLPLTFVDNCADAIVLAAFKEGIEGEAFNVVDDDLITSREFLKRYKERVRGFRSVPIPYVVARALSSFWEDYSRKTNGQLPPVFNRRRCSAEWKGNRYSNRKLYEKLGWTPRVKMGDAMSAFLEQFGRS